MTTTAVETVDTAVPPPEAQPEIKKGRKIDWYRTPIDKQRLKELSQRSNLLGFKQVLGYYSLYFLTIAGALYSFERWHWSIAILFVYLHGIVSAFGGGCAVHELTHNTVFRTKWLNEFFCRFASLFSWWSWVWFQTSHLRHHAYTLHPPDDLEVTLPSQMPRHKIIEWLKFVVCNPQGMYYTIKGCVDNARGKIVGEWNNKLFPVGDPKRDALIRWARIMLTFHALLLVGSVAGAVYLKMWSLLLLPVMISCGGSIGSWLVFLCGMPQHFGLTDNVADFRKSCRTYTTNPLCRLLYWQMNYHIDHHMFPTVPCYRLKQLHKEIKHDLPPTPQGLWACWRDMLAISKKLRVDPTYKHNVKVPQEA